MEKIQQATILNNLYGLLMEINFHRSSDEILVELSTQPDELVENQLLKMKQLSLQLKAQASRQRYESAFEQFKLLKERGLDELKNLLQPQEKVQLQPLFRKFEELSGEDEKSILDDQDLLLLINILQKKLDDSEDTND